MDSVQAPPTPSSPILDFHRRNSYSASVPSSASSASSSVFSADVGSSQSSVASSACSSSLDVVWEADSVTHLSCSDHYLTRHTSPPAISTVGAAVTDCDRSCTSSTSDAGVRVAPDQRLNRRRTNRGECRNGCSASAAPRPPPALVRQSDRKVNFVDSLVDSATQIVEVIWPLSNVACRSASAGAGGLGTRGVLPLRTFIQETLRRSRTSYSTLQVALYYLILIRNRVPKHDFTMEQPEDSPTIRALQCGRRMFLAGLILASKYLQDKNYSARAWSKISGLSTQEINMNEMTFLGAIGWRLHVSEPTFQRWTDIILKYTPSLSSTSSSSPLSTSRPSSPVFSEEKKVNWTTILDKFTPELLQKSCASRVSRH